MRARFATALILGASLGCAEQAGPGDVARVTIDSYGTVFVGQTLQLSASVTDESSNTLPDLPVIWQSSNETAVTVSPTGLAQGISEGSARITATCEGVSGTTRIESLIDLRGSWRGSTADGATHYVTLISNEFCSGAACANAGHGGWTRFGTGGLYTVGYGSRDQGTISFDLWNTDDRFHFVGRYGSDSMTGMMNGAPIVFTRTSSAASSY